MLCLGITVLDLIKFTFFLVLGMCFYTLILLSNYFFLNTDLDFMNFCFPAKDKMV